MINIVTWLDFGIILHQARIAQDLSQEQLAERVGCHRTYIWKLEQGKSRPSKKFLHILTYECPALRGDLTLFATFALMAAYRLEDSASLQQCTAYKVTSAFAL